MKTTAFRYALYWGISLFPLTAPAQEEELKLYLQPDIESRLITSTPLTDSRLGPPAPVLDEAKAALGWHYAEYTDAIEGYVPDAKIGKDLLPVDDTVIRSGPSPDSPVLGVYRDGDEIEVIETGTWWEIRSEMAFPVYFVLDSPPALPPVTAAAAGDEAEESSTLEELPPEDPPSPVIREETIVDAGAGAVEPVRPAPEARPKPPEFLGQSYRGTFKKAKKHLGLFRPKAPFYLEGSDGRRIAWVDTNNIVVTGSLQSYLDKEVVVHGERTLMDNSSEWIIRARNMRRN